MRFTDILLTWFILFFIYCAALKGRAAFCLTNDSISFATYVVRMWITPCQRRNRVIFVPCAALAIDAERRMHEETRTQTSDLDNNSRDNICECILFCHVEWLIADSFLSVHIFIFRAKTLENHLYLKVLRV